MEQHSPDYRTVAVFWALVDAELARGLLEADGIPVALQDAGAAALLPGTAGVSVRLLVPAADLPRAREILADTGGAGAVTDPEAGGEPGDQPSGWALTWLTVVGAALGIAALAAAALLL